MADENRIEQAAEQNEEQSLSEILQIRRDKLARLKETGNDPFIITSFERDTYAAPIMNDFDSYEGKAVRVAGRVMSRRDMGKASFFDILDSSGRIQIYLRRDDIGEDAYDALKLWDIGDIAGVAGEVFRTRTGQISIKATEVTLLSKSLLPLPEKFHGLTNTDLRYRQRYVDLIVNPQVRDVFVARSKIIREMRHFLDVRGFLEVETPILQTQAGGAAARPFQTHHNTLGLDMYMRIAPELYLKRLIVGGFDKVYEIGRNFRNEGMSPRHNPEFTMLELYEAYTDYHGMMEITESLIRTVAENVFGKTVFEFDGVEIDLGKPFTRLPMLEAVRKYADVDFEQIETLDQAREAAKSRGIEFEPRHGKGDILNLFFERYCEDKLTQPTFIIDHPVEISPLAKRKPDAPDYTERFELFITGREFGNAFSELNDPIDQRIRFEHQAALKAAGDEEAVDVDEDFLNALGYGLPPTGGVGIGVERLVMLLTNSFNIRDVLLFPTMKPL